MEGKTSDNDEYNETEEMTKYDTDKMMHIIRLMNRSNCENDENNDKQQWWNSDNYENDEHDNKSWKVKEKYQNLKNDKYKDLM